MNTICRSERETQTHVIKIFENELGYTYLGNRLGRANNSNIEEDDLKEFLRNQGYNNKQIEDAIFKLKAQADDPNRDLYQNNREVYKRLRYGVDSNTITGTNTDTIKLIDWEHPEKNLFAIAEEVKLSGNHARTPDLVLYINGIAFGVIELKKSTVSIGDGIRQNISNQKLEYNAWFFSTVQILVAGSDSEGLRYGTIKTPEQFYMKWKEDEKDDSRSQLDKYLLKLFDKKRILELMHDFIIFEGGKKTLPYHQQYFAIKKSQQFIGNREGGIIWHSQGSGKSHIMVSLARWILEHDSQARVIIVTDRDELDKQIEEVFSISGVQIKRARSGKELIPLLGDSSSRLICSLIHKFNKNIEDKYSTFAYELSKHAGSVNEQFIVFVDECHRSQTGILHDSMKKILKDAIYIGFTGTPLLKEDARSTMARFGKYIHVYKYDEAVTDEIVLPLSYDGRDINQIIGDEKKIDEWFETKTRCLSDKAKNQLARKWATLEKVLSTKSRLNRIVGDIVCDFNTKDRLLSGKGNAILVADGIFNACRYYQMFQETDLKDRCAIITSANIASINVSTEDTGAGPSTNDQYVYNTYQEILKSVTPVPQVSKHKTYEDLAKAKFIKEPENMKLLIVVDKLLTGFNAPSCTYIYLDKPMHDHGLFQAICRTNRRDGDGKPFGRIVDYMNLFSAVESAIKVYTKELDYSTAGAKPDVLMHNHLLKSKEYLNNAISTLDALCASVPDPKERPDYIRYFCGNTDIETDIARFEPHRKALYKAVMILTRAYAEISGQLKDAGYDDREIQDIKSKHKNYSDLRSMIGLASGDVIDMKSYESTMRQLLDNYIIADSAKKISKLDDVSLLELISKSGIDNAVDSMPDDLKSNQTAVAEIIENNVRRTIIIGLNSNPVFYENLSKQLNKVIELRKKQAIQNREYLKQMEELARIVFSGAFDDTPASLDTPGKKALYYNLGKNEELALEIDALVKANHHDSWKGNRSKEDHLKYLLYDSLKDMEQVEDIFEIVKNNAEYK